MEASVGSDVHDEADQNINGPSPRRPRRDPTRPSTQEEAGAAKCRQEEAQRQQLHLKKKSHNKTELLSSTRLNRPVGKLLHQLLDMQGSLAEGFVLPKATTVGPYFQYFSHKF